MSRSGVRSYLPNLFSPKHSAYLPVSQSSPSSTPRPLPYLGAPSPCHVPPQNARRRQAVLAAACLLLVAAVYTLVSPTVHSPYSPASLFSPNLLPDLPRTSHEVVAVEEPTARSRLAALNAHYDPLVEPFGKGRVKLAAYRQELLDAYATYVGPEDGALDLLLENDGTATPPTVPALLPQLECHLSLSCNATLPIPPAIYFTDRVVSPPPPSIAQWTALNPALTATLFSDSQVALWIANRFPNGAIPALFDALPPWIPILKYDLFRLLVLLRGGTYTDTDTVPVLPMAKWANNVVALGPEHVLVDEEILKRPPSLVVGLEWVGESVNELNPLYSRRVGFVQWTFSAAPGHPVIVDAIRQIAENTAAVAAYWDNSTRPSTLHFDPEAPRAVLEWTGPAVLSDAVTRYLRTRWGASTASYSSSSVPLRIGDVLILPVAALNTRSRLGMKLLDWALGRNPNPLSTSQDCVIHQHAASWWGQGMHLKPER